MHFFRIKKQSLFLSLAIFLLVPSSAFAARLSLEPNSIIVGTNEEFIVRVMVDTEGQSDNAFSGDIVFSENIELLSTSLEDSIVSTWIKSPEVSGNSVNFMGITQGGFNGVIDPFSGGIMPGAVFTMRFRASHAGSAQIEFVEGKILRNDGLATVENTSLGSATVVVGEHISEFSNVPVKTDEFPPEKFIMKIATHPSVFGGKYFLAFDTIDKGSKVESFHVREGRRDWILAESPYLLEDQTLRSRIWVKATDSFGNFRVEHMRATVRPAIPTPLIIIPAAILILYRLLRKNKS